MELNEYLTPEFIADAEENIDEQLEAKAEEDSKRTVEIYDDFIHYDNGHRVLRIPQPTLGFLKLYHERREYFWDDELGIGRLLVALRRQKEGRGQYVRALRCGEEIPDEEADSAMSDVHPQDVPDYYHMLKTCEGWAAKEAEKKTAKLVWGEDAENIKSALAEALHNLSSLPGTQSTS